MKMRAEELLAKGERITKISIFTLVCLGILLLLVGFLSDSVALRGSGVDTLGDAFISFIVLIGLRMLNKPPDARFQYGYYKIESLVSMVVSIALGLIGLWIFYISYLSFISPRELGYPAAAIAISAISAASFFALAVYKGKIANEIDSLAMKTDSKNSLVSGLSSSVVLIGLALSYLGVYHADAVAGMVMAAFTFLTSYFAIRESSLVLLDVCTCPRVRGNIKEIAESVEGVKRVHEILLRKSGPYILGDMHIKLDGRLSVHDAHEIVERIEKLAKKKVPFLKRLTIKVEPIKKRPL